jgi:hypothetical protein
MLRKIMTGPCVLVEYRNKTKIQIERKAETRRGKDIESK